MKIKSQFIEVATINEALPWFRGNQTAAAEHLGINRNTLRRYITESKGHVRVKRDQYAEIVGFELL